jgi:hypothetical protein
MSSEVRILLYPLFFVELQADVAQLVEHFLGKEEVTGSNPLISSGFWRIGFTSVAQLVEQRSPKPQVGGSIPS